jgi:GTP-binding protein SAR1
MFILDWFKGVLNWLGLSQKKGKILFLGLDNAGKTTLMHLLKNDRIGAHPPTFNPHSEDLVIDNIRFKAFDLGGHHAARMLWQDYFATINGIVYIVDASDRSRFAESAEELKKLIMNTEQSKVPIVVLGNKIDVASAASADDFRVAFSLPAHLTYGMKLKKESTARPVEVFMCSVAKRMGFREGFQWLGQFLE